MNYYYTRNKQFLYSLGDSPEKRQEFFEVGDKLFVKIRGPLIDRNPNQPDGEQSIFREIKRDSSKNLGFDSSKKSGPVVRNDKEKGSVSHFSDGYHIGNFKKSTYISLFKLFLLILMQFGKEILQVPTAFTIPMDSLTAVTSIPVQDQWLIAILPIKGLIGDATFVNQMETLVE